MNHQLTPVARAAETVAQSELDRLLQQRTFTPLDLLQDQNFDKLWRMADALANSALSIPKELKGNVGDCMAIVTQAMIWGLNPFAVAQKAHVINGKLGYEAQLVNAVVMQSGAIRGSFSYEYEGDRCRVGAVLRGESSITWGEWLSAASVQTRNSPLWKVNPKQQMGYLQVKNWARAYCPGALLGIYTADELEAADATPEAEQTAAATRGPQRKSAQAKPDAAAPAQPAQDRDERPEPENETDTRTTDAPAPTKPAAPVTTAPAGAINGGQVKYLRAKMAAAGVEEASIVERFELPDLEHMNVQQFDEIKSELLAMT